MGEGENLVRRKTEYFQGCMIGGAIGDALGAPVEFWSYQDIIGEYGDGGIQDLIYNSDHKAEITDDTQMTIFTAEGIIRSICRQRTRGVCSAKGVVFHAYLRWLHTQGFHTKCMRFTPVYDGWLMTVYDLFESRAPGNTCITALMGGEIGTIEKPINNSKGCGGVMRVAPVGLSYEKEYVFDRASEFAAITHGHPLGYYTAGVFALIISNIISGMNVSEAVLDSLEILKLKYNHPDFIKLIEYAIELSNSSTTPEACIKNLGEGWVAEEALAIAVYSALKAGTDFRSGVIIAVNHSGDSDSTGSMTGNILGAYLGLNAIPADWVQNVELSSEILELANDLFIGYQDDAQWWEKYPGW
jgi:ADP-ribosylglycohydrolase